MLLVTGAAGFLGSSFTLEAIAAGKEVVGAVHMSQPEPSAARLVSADLSDLTAARNLIQLHKPEWVVNCTGLTNVDECERDPRRALLLNAELPRNLALACAETGSKLVHISTDSVFDGKRGNYTEDDLPAPLNVYAHSKLEGERRVQEVLPAAIVMRTNFIGLSRTRATGLADWVAGRLENGQQMAGFDDVIFSPLLISELSEVILGSVDLNLSGLFHASSSDSCSKYDFAMRLGAALGCDTSVIKRASVASAGMLAPRPMNISLVPARLERALGRQMPSVDSAIKKYANLRVAHSDAMS